VSTLAGNMIVSFNNISRN